jgi:DNA primase catalytic subunit
MDETLNSKEQRIRKITHLYYSKPEIQNILFEFSKDREVCPRYFEGFGKRPDSLQYPNDIFELVKKGATSFHCSEELWKNPLKIETGMAEKQLNELRKGWDLLIDIDSKYIDYSKISAQQIIKLLNFYGIKNIGIKFSGSKGFHIIVPWKALPKEINGIKTSDMFPDWARIVVQYIIDSIKKELIDKITDLSRPSKYIKDFQVSEEVMPDLILVSPRHLFRMPYSLHEKTSLSSVVLSEEELKNFQLTDASPMNVKIKSFMPNSKEGEASRLFMEALDWFKSKSHETKKSESSFAFKPIKFENLSENNFPPSIQKILLGVKDGKKRALFILINFFRSINMEKEEIEKRIFEWNKKNTPVLTDGYIKTQLLWSFRKPPVMPPNYDKDYYKGIGIAPTLEEINSKNPVNYMVKKNFKLQAK